MNSFKKKTRREHTYRDMAVPRVGRCTNMRAPEKTGGERRNVEGYLEM